MIWVYGSVDFAVSAWLPEHLEGTPADVYGLARVDGDGVIGSNQSIHYTTNSIVVANPTDTNKASATQAGAPEGAPKTLYKQLSAGPDDKDSAEGASSAVSDSGQRFSDLHLPSLAPILEGVRISSTSNTPTRATAIASAVDKFVRRRAAAGERAAQARQGFFFIGRKFCADCSGGGSSGRTNTRGSHDSFQQEGLGVNTKRERFLPPIAARKGWVSRNSTHGSNVTTRADGIGDIGDIGNRCRISRKVLNGIKQTLLERFGHDRSDDIALISAFDKKDHPEPTLKVGQELHGRLVGPSGQTMAHASWIDGALRYTWSYERVHIRLDRIVEVHKGEVSKTLIEPDPRKLAKVVEIRGEILAELGWGDGSEFVSEVSKRGLGEKKAGKFAAIMKFQPFGKHGFRHQRARQQAIKHLGQSTISVTDRGVAEARVDGRIVWRYGGPSFFNIRRRDASYELHATGDGIGVTRRGEAVWSLSANGPPRLP
ncbi:unnamed protein product [Scytosiphon promiscuus]